MARLRLALVAVALLAASLAIAAEDPPQRVYAPVSGASAPPASAEVPARPGTKPGFTLDLSLGVGRGDSTGSEPLVSWGLHATLRPRRLVLAASMEGATNFFGSLHGFFTGGWGAPWT